MQRKQIKNNKESQSILSKITKLFRVTYDVSWNIILFFLVIGFIGMFFAGGIGAGYFASLVKDEPVRSYASMKEEIYTYEETSKTYFADNVYIGDLNADIQREDTTLDNISPILTSAVIATEDEYFRQHEGVVPKAILRAVVQEATNASMKTGGSTLTQQLIKLQILTNEVSFDRKAKEILLALRLEKVLSKDEILEAYLNIIPYGRNAAGRNIAGVQTASKGLFGVDADKVNLSQAAFLAGLPQSPYAYTPYKSGGGLKNDDGLAPGINRMKVVLKRMLDSKYINLEEYEVASAYDIKEDFVKPTTSSTEKYPYLIQELEKRAVDVLITVLAKKDGYAVEDLKDENGKNKDNYYEYEALAERNLRSGGYNIHSSIDKDLYEQMQETMKDVDYLGPKRTFTDANENEKTERVQAGAVLIENSTGRILSFVGGREFTRGENENNYIRTERPNGSTMKPILVYAPGLDMGVIQPATPVLDSKHSYEGGQEVNNFSQKFYGVVSAREALTHSYNISALKLYNLFRDENPAKNYLNKMNFNINKEEQTFEGLPLGQSNVSVETNTGAFATLANAGQFNETHMIDKITTHDGETVFEYNTEPVDIYSPEASYLTVNMMRNVLEEGTGTYLNSQLKDKTIDWAGKSGTSSEAKDIWFVATNPNVSFGTWMGYDTPSNVNEACITDCPLPYHHQRIQKLWAELINDAAEINPELVTPKNEFEQPETVVKSSYCAISGLLPSELCEKVGLVKEDLFDEKYLPTEEDHSLMEGNYVTVDGKSVVAGPKTPGEFVSGSGIAFDPDFFEENGYDELEDISDLYPLVEDRALWEKIALPSGKKGSKLTDSGVAPSAPTSLSASGNQLTWNKSNGNNVIGYRIYFNNKVGEPLKKIGSTTSTKIAFSGNTSVFYVKAVDYFGRESEASNPVQVGDPNKAEKEKKKKEKEELETKKEAEKAQKEKENKVEELKDEEKENEEEINEE